MRCRHVGHAPIPFGAGALELKHPLDAAPGGAQGQPAGSKHDEARRSTTSDRTRERNECRERHERVTHEPAPRRE
ncbi:hypothetical protein WK03_01815 [Burkholderia cepacia]|nr:hypothetical protein WK03_01815 [Burkholderia cepacia]